MISESDPAEYAPFWIDVAKALMGRARFDDALEMLQKAYQAMPNPSVSFSIVTHE
jgi:hypothetical protein